MKTYKPTHKFEIHLHSNSEKDLQVMFVVNGQVATKLLESASSQELERICDMLDTIYSAIVYNIKPDK